MLSKRRHFYYPVDFILSFLVHLGDLPDCRCGDWRWAADMLADGGNRCKC